MSTNTKEEVTITVNYDEILALSTSINVLFDICKAEGIKVPK